MHLGYVVGYEMALEKLGYYSEEALDIIKQAGGEQAVKAILPKVVGGAEKAAPAAAKAAPAAAKAAPAAEKAVAKETAKEPAKKPGASAVDWFSRRTPLEQAAMLGGSGLGTLGAGVGLGHALSD